MSEKQTTHSTLQFDQIQNFKTVDPFADVSVDGVEGIPFQSSLIHIRLQQRNGRKSLTTLQGLAESIDHQKLLRRFKKDLRCGGNLVRDPQLGCVLQLQGDQRHAVADFLAKENLADAKNIKIHGHA